MSPVPELRSLVGEARRLTAELSPEDLFRRPARGGWSVAECLQHLNVANRLYTDAISRSLSESRSRGLTGSGKHRLSAFERLLVYSVGPPARLKIKAPAVFLPGEVTDSDGIVAEWETVHETLIRLAADAERSDSMGLRVASPVSAKLKMSLLAAFFVAVAHDRRHLWQIAEIRKSS